MNYYYPMMAYGGWGNGMGSLIGSLIGLIIFVILILIMVLLWKKIQWMDEMRHEHMRNGEKEKK